MTDQPLDPEQAAAGMFAQAGQMLQLLSAHGQELMSGGPRRLYERVPWERVNELAAGGWELTAVMSAGLHVMQRQYNPADEAERFLTGGPG